jgi:hypothetical protein
VEAVAVELDGEALAGPAAVDEARARGTVRLRQRETLGAQEPQELTFQDAEGDGLGAGEDAAQVGGPGRGPCDQRLDLLRRGAVPDLRLVAGPAEGIERERAGEVDQGLGDGGGGDGAAGGSADVVRPSVPDPL